jgi:bacillithiol biosynthesis cysteine-adding enzyme BshC
LNIPFNQLPGYNELFLDYIDDFDSVNRFFEYDFKSDEDFLKCIELTSESYRNGRQFLRKDLTAILSLQNQNFGSGQKALDNVAALNDSNTLAVVTGQQLGILSGPMYTIIKALNTIQLSDKLKSQFPEYNFVPVFWMEAEDHDFLEINNISVVSKENELKRLTYFERGIEDEKYLKPAGSMQFDGEIDKLVNELSETLGKTDFSATLFEAIAKSYKSGNSIKEAFGQFLNFVLGDRGIVLVDPSDPALKNLLKPVFKTALESSALLAEKVISTTVDLESSHIAQVKPKPINLFYIHEGNRYLIEPREGGNYALKNSRHRFSKDELLEKLETSTENFSWNVITRPICQDYLLPTVSYIGGPSEISYFAQLREAYKVFDMNMPVVYPRTSVTILDARTKTFMEKNSIQFKEMFDERELMRSIVKRSSDKNPEEIFSKMKDELNAIFYTYDKELSLMDSNQSSAFSKRCSQFVESLDVAREKFITAQAKQNEVITGQLSKVLLNVYPGSMPQERLLNISMFYNKYGSNLIEILLSEISIDTFMHQTIDPSPRRE